MLNNQDATTPEESTENTSNVPATVERKKFQRDAHIKYFKLSLKMLPSPYASQDGFRMTLGMFALGGLELLGVLEEKVSEADRKAWIEWIYSQQRIPSDANNKDSDEVLYGFGSPFSGLPFTSSDDDDCQCKGHSPRNVYDTAHITMTYTALLMLVVLGDDLSRVAKEPILKSLKRLQQPNGCFIPCITDFEPDMRFLYCAAAISYILNDWSGFNRATAVHYIQQCQTYENGFSQYPGQEAHGGSTYCAVAALGLMGGDAFKDQKTMTRNIKEGEDEVAFEQRKLRAGFLDKEGIRRWCLQRQTTGFQGRSNKPTDTCYSFWVGGALAILDSMDLVDFEANRGYLMEAQHKSIGGFGKWIDTFPDILHSYMGIAGLSLMQEPGVLPMDPLLNVSKRSQERLFNNTVFWKKNATES
ncbi:Geranylgeranyl transferase type-1 subunit beta [Lobosporangium transversale]|uniref:Geranylgeranyl transferase type-1 subunit beta n=1 Tax=Lobosporangium transversale TaxID=64571 RepID=A0A1Y2GCJ7_9FUNG|nr:terpenoid cyclases/protein prenyltransferase alpha-alpha toroid [Lobosporangium transversale]KAF9903935.1 Geranylgeranyl transferase type-1 subunit beta [Lobosporangium transversale]ORZ05197.1 terpenoid cyclases/protein prenyltransferase alpha-alpha toroid [Lobosporangium transversale]|eukprot:XP_021876972.1 terpenoid cyclases/protein prenyltransferase alpha-alpha toroid [Lobosporangium transversale]